MASRVLLVLASPVESAALALALARQGLAPTCASRAADALAALSGEARPDAVVMDWTLPDMDGLEAVRVWKGRAQDEFLPAVLLCREGDAGARVRGLLAGADDVVARPLAADELSARLVALLRIKASQDSLRLAKQELERLSITDALTGLFNRRYFEYRLEQELERSRRHGAPLALALLDVDHFKRINDRYGHRQGDAVLRALAEVLRGELRRVDVCTRWGGEEFAVILPDTDPHGAAVVVERLLRAARARLRFAAEPVRGPAHHLEPFHVTVSAGVCAHPFADADGADELVAAADAALYRAKHEGRDRACFAFEAEAAPGLAATTEVQAAVA